MIALTMASIQLSILHMLGDTLAHRSGSQAVTLKGLLVLAKGLKGSEWRSGQLGIAAEGT